MGRIFVSANSLEILNCPFESIYRTTISKTAHKKLNGRVAQTENVILVGNVCANALKHKKNKLAKATRVYEKVLGAEQKEE